MALRYATQEVMLLRQLLTKLSLVLKHPTSMMEDNKGCISFAKNTMTTNKSKHVNVKMHFFVMLFVTNLLFFGGVRLMI